MRFLSVCSGIEAASVAWNPLGWQAVAFSEIEKFPSAVLAHHYPDVPNLGDFTKIDTATLGPVDILSGGTPCQAFSVAGLRQSLDDARGNLSLEFVRLAHELAVGNGLRNVIWENVPGVLSTKDNAFGCFLGALVGADGAVPPPSGKRWPDAGMVDGPKGRAAWRILDAQYFGLAQRRRRVIVVADFGAGADPAEVLFELEGVPGNPAPSREARKDIAPTISARTKGGGGLGTDFDLDGGLVEAAPVPIDMRQASRGATMTNNRPEGTSGGAPGTGIGKAGDPSPTISTSHIPAVYAPEIARCVATREGSSQDYETTTMVAVDYTNGLIQGDITGTLEVAQSKGNRGQGVIEAVCVTVPVTHTLKADGFDASEDGTGRGQPIVAFDTTQITSKANRSNPQAGDPCHPLSATAHPPAITVALRGREGGEVATALRASTGGGDKPHVLTSAVRRLTPRECERLMGFPDDYTLIPYRNKLAADGPRYKALGNSWAVPKFVWLGRRIAALMPVVAANDNTSNTESQVA